MDFNASHKEEVSSYLGFGVHKVKILGFNLGGTGEGEKEYVEVGFVSEDGAFEDKARVWFSTDNAAKFSFNTLRTIFLHNCPEEKRDAARKAIDAVASTAKLVEMLESKLIGKEMWATKYLDPKRTYEKNGRTFQSINTNIYGYEPKLNEALMPKAKESAAEAASAVFGEATPADAPPFTGSGTSEQDWV